MALPQPHHSFCALASARHGTESDPIRINRGSLSGTSVDTFCRSHQCMVHVKLMSVQ